VKQAFRRPLLPLRSVSLTLALASFAYFSVPCEHLHANDTEAEIGLGGLVLIKSANIEIRSEDLYVSIEEIKVRYRFYNRANTAVTTHVAFPMPDIVFSEDPDTPYVTEHEFFTRVDGVPVKTKIEQRAMVGGRDRSDILKRLSIPLNPVTSQEALNNLPRQSRDELTKSGLAKASQNGSLEPRWTLKTTYYWEQTFPAKKEITIDHRYEPIVGGTVPSTKWTDMRLGDSLFSEYQKEFCIDQDFVRSARQFERQQQSGGESWISYILKTGRNWATPIGEFRLVVDKGDPRNITSFCAEGVKKINATQFEMRKKNFVPSRDLKVLILRRK
jgi:hypothetical protein